MQDALSKPTVTEAIYYPTLTQVVRTGDNAKSVTADAHKNRRLNNVGGVAKNSVGIGEYETTMEHRTMFLVQRF